MDKEIIDYINHLKKTTPEEIRMITLSCYKIAFLSSITFGLTNSITKDCLNILREYIDICNNENTIFNFILDNIQYLDLEETINYLEDLDTLNEMTYLYYDGLIADIEYAIETKNPNRGKRTPCHFNTLLDSGFYYEKLSTLKK